MNKVVERQERKIQSKTYGIGLKKMWRVVWGWMKGSRMFNTREKKILKKKKKKN